MTHKVYNLRVFAAGPNGGNPLSVVVDAQGMSPVEMQAVAANHGHESGFVFPASEASGCDFEFVFWVPEHEMEMCGHATVGAVWLLEKLNRLKHPEVRIMTKSGIVKARVSKSSQGIWVEVSQPAGVVDTVAGPDDIEALVSVLGISKQELADLPIHNSKTSRVKTLVPLRSTSQLNSLKPNFHLVKGFCERIGSTGLYPYALSDAANQVFNARQFPKSSGYNEDAATGIAAAALSYGLLRNGLVGDTEKPLRVRQGWSMGCPSGISVRFRQDCDGCWIGGTAVEETDT